MALTPDDKQAVSLADGVPGRAVLRGGATENSHGACRVVLKSPTAVRNGILVRVFLSYGHDEYASLASRIKHDLEALGHDVWFDVERLKASGDWERYIEDGLDFASAVPEAGRFLLLMTPHSVRRPEGYCLNELARAFGRNLPVIPVMVSTVEPPLSIGRLQYLDMRQCFPTEQHEEQYKKQFEQLLNALIEREVPFEGVQQRLLNYLDPISPGDDFSRHLARFTGREWVMAEVEEWLASSRRVLWIAGDVGVGKSALAAWLCDKRPEIAAYHFCRFGNSGRVDARKALLSLAYQLSTQFPDYRDRLNASPLDKIAIEPNAPAVFERLFVEPLKDLAPARKPQVLLIDALDEASRNGKNELAALVGGEFDRLPPWLRVIVTSRPHESEINFDLQALDPWMLDVGRPENLDDIRKYLGRELQPFTGNVLPPEQVLNTIVDKSEGLFLYVSWVRQELQEGRLLLQDVGKLPRGLGGVYKHFFERYFPDLPRYESDCRPALEAICAAREPLERDDLVAMFGWSEYQMDSLAGQLGSLFPVRDGRMRPFHQSVRDWLTDRQRSGPYRVDAHAGEQRLAGFGWWQYKQGVDMMRRYCLVHEPSHLAACERKADLKELLLDPGWMAAKLNAAGVVPLLGDYDLVLNLLSDERVNAERKIQHALTLSSQALHADRSQLAAQLIARLLDDDDPQIRSLLKLAAQSSPIPWLCPLVRSLAAPLGSLQVRLFGHELRVCDLVIGQEGTRLISGSRDGTIRIWDLVGSEPCRILTGHTEGISALVLEPASGRLVSASWDMTLRVWDLDTGETVQTLRGHNECVLAVDIMPSTGHIVSSGPDGTIRIWDLQSGAEIRKMSNFSKSVFDLTITPDGTHVLCVGYDESVKMIGLQSGLLIRRFVGHADGAAGNAIAVTDDGRFAVSASHDKTLKIWDLSTGDHVRTLEGHTGGVESVFLFPGGRLALSGSNDGTMKMWDLHTGENTRTFYGHEGPVDVVVGSPTRAQAFSGSEDCSVASWNLNNESSLPRVRIPGGVASMAVAKNRRQAIFGNFWGELHFWDFEDPSRSKVLTGHGKAVRGAKITPDGRWAVSWGGDKMLRVWNLEQLAQFLCFEAAGGFELSTEIAISNDGRRSAFATDEHLITWDLETGKELARSQHDGIKDGFAEISFTADGHFVLLPTKESVNFHDVITHEVVRSLTDCGSIGNFALSSDDQLIAVSAYHDIRFWDLTKPDHSVVLCSEKGLCHSVDITSDGKVAVTAGSERLVRVWDVELKEILASFATEGELDDCFIADDGKFVMAAESSGTVHVLRLDGTDNR